MELVVNRQPSEVTSTLQSWRRRSGEGVEFIASSQRLTLLVGVCIGSGVVVDGSLNLLFLLVSIICDRQRLG